METENTKKNFIWNTIGLTLNSFNSLLFLVIVKWVNGLAISGIFSYAFSLCSLFFVVSIYYNRTYQIADYGGDKKFNHFFTFRLLTCLISLIAIAAFAFINRFSIEKITVIILLMFFRSIEAVSDCLFGYIQKEGKLYQVGISYTIKALGGVLLFLTLDILTHNVFVAILGIIIVNVIVLLTYDANNLKKLLYGEAVRIDNSQNILILKQAFPIFIFTFLSMYMANVQKYVMTYFVTDEMQSIFGILIMPATMLSLVSSYLVTPYVTKMNNLVVNLEYKKFFILTMKILLCLFAIGIIGLIICYFIGIPILSLIYHMDLSEYRFSLEIIISGSILYASVSVISNSLTILQSNISQVLMYLFASLASTFISDLLTRKYGLSGAAWSYFIGNMICLLMFIVYFIIILIHVNDRKKNNIGN